MKKLMKMKKWVWEKIQKKIIRTKKFKKKLKEVKQVINKLVK